MAILLVRISVGLISTVVILCVKAVEMNAHRALDLVTAPALCVQCGTRRCHGSGVGSKLYHRGVLISL